MGFGNLANTFVGPSAAAFSKDEVAAAKVLFGYAKDHEKLKIKAGIVDGKVTSTTDLKTLSTLPNKTGLVSMLLSALQGPARNLAYALKSVSEKK
jgi:large subunit ribosomal protein L10